MDLLRIVSFSRGGRPVVEFDIEQDGLIQKVQDSVKITPGDKHPIVAQQSGRYGGGVQVDESQENGTFKATWLIQGATEDACIALNNEFLAKLEDTAFIGRALEFRPSGASRSIFYPLRATGVWAPEYRTVQFDGAQSLMQEVVFTIAPLAEWPRMDIFDDFTFPADAVVLAENLVTNPSFEVDAAGWTKGGTGLFNSFLNPSGASDPLGLQTPIAGGSGSFSGRVAGDGSAGNQGGGTFLGGPLEAGVTYRVQMVLESTTSLPSLQVGIAGGPTAPDQMIVAEATTAGVPLVVAFDWTPPTDQAHPILFVRNNAATVSFVRVDAVQVSTETGYFTGEFDMCRWRGTKNASVSERMDGATFDDYEIVSGTRPTIAGDGYIYVPAGTKMRESARGYDLEDVQVTVEAVVPTGVFNYFASPAIKWLDDENYLFATNEGGSLKLFLRQGGGNTALGSVSHGVLTAGNTVWVRIRSEGNTITSELFTSMPFPMSTPAVSLVTVLAGGNAMRFGAGVAGGVAPIGWHHGGGTIVGLGSFRVEPYTYRNQTLPQKIALGGVIPGDAPAKCDLEITPAGGAAAPVFALAGWTKRARSPLAGSVAPFGIVEAETAVNLSGWAVGFGAEYRNGLGLEVLTSGFGAFSAEWVIDPSVFDPDDFAMGDLGIEVWARTRVASTVVNPIIIAAARPDTGLDYGAERFTTEFGNPGKTLAAPPSAGAAFRFTRLGILPLVSFPDEPAKWRLRLTGIVDSGSFDVFGLDYLVLTRADLRACNPTGKVLGLQGQYPRFVNSTAETIKTVRYDLSAKTAQPGTNPFPDSGLGGSLLDKVPAGPVDLLVKLSSLVPDDPTVSTGSEQKEHAATVHLAVTPRSYLFRP